MTDSLTFTLPMPISVNGAYANGGNRRGRHKTARANEWARMATLALGKQKVYIVNPPYHIIYSFGRPDKRRRDAFNYEKLLSDFLVLHHILVDDCEINIGTVEWDKSVSPGQVRISIKSLGE